MFKDISEDVMQGSCPYCDKDAFIYVYEDKKMFLCHHCQRHLNHSKVKFNVDSNSTISGNIGLSVNSNINYSSILHSCKVLSDLSNSHACVEYIRNRGIDNSHYSELYYCEDFGEIAKFAGVKLPASKRLILPFIDEKGDLFGLQGRALDGSEPRYITLMFKEDKEKLYGKNKVDMTKTFYVVEGPIDSLFLKNCIAMAGSDGINDKYNSNAVLVFDNEPRNKQIVDKVEKYIDKGFKTVIWPNNIKQKDINDMVLQGVDVQSIVEQNTYAGLAAKIQFNVWKKVNG